LTSPAVATEEPVRSFESIPVDAEAGRPVERRKIEACVEIGVGAEDYVARSGIVSCTRRPDDPIAGGESSAMP
jgi:hypothetical protein